MSLLGPIASQLFMYLAIGAGMLVVTAYIIKMRRRRFEVPFSQLWRRVLDTKDANALWKQLKRLLSLLLILSILGLIFFSAMDPTLGAIDRRARSVVILLDSSASMKATDGDEAGKMTRLDAAKKSAKKLIDSMGGGDVAMVMKVDGQATPMSRFTADSPQLDKVVDGIQASDTPADLPRALAAAADALRDRPNPLVVLVSDGAFPEAQLGQVIWGPDANASGDDALKQEQAYQLAKKTNLAAVDLKGIDVRYLPVGKRSDNVGIIAFNVRRYIANKAAYEVFIEVQNFGTEPAHRKLSLKNGETPVDTKMIELAPGQRIRQIYQKLPATEENQLRASLQPVDQPGGSDPFALDDDAFALLPLRKKQKVLMVTDDNLFLEGALLVYDNIDPTKVKPEDYAKNPLVADGMDVVIFDDYTPEVLPPPPSSLIFFHPTGEHSPIKIAHEVARPHITELDEQHPVMRWVTMSDVFMDKSSSFSPDATKGESTLAYAVNDSIVAAKRDGKRKILAFGFSLPASGRDGATDLTMRVAFPMLLVNALDWFAGDQADLLTTYTTGVRQRVPLDGVVGATEAEVKAPDGVVTHVPVIDSLATFYANRVGIYDLAAKTSEGKAIAQIQLAANLASPTESNITPSAELKLAGKTLEAPEAFAITHSQKLWIYLVLLAAILIGLEWITYHRRITV